MELLCVLAVMLALFLACAALTLKARVPAGLAPLTALSAIVALFTLAGMAGLLLPAAWAVYALCVAGGVWALWPRKGAKPDWKALFTPRQCALLGHGAGLCRLFLCPPAFGHRLR